MRQNRFTNAVLVVIAVLLAVIAFKPLMAPEIALAQSRFSGVQFSGSLGGFWAFDSRTGQVWIYSTERSIYGQCEYVGKITELGKPLSK